MNLIEEEEEKISTACITENISNENTPIIIETENSNEMDLNFLRRKRNNFLMSFIQSFKMRKNRFLLTLFLQIFSIIYIITVIFWEKQIEKKVIYLGLLFLIYFFSIIYIWRKKIIKLLRKNERNERNKFNEIIKKKKIRNRNNLINNELKSNKDNIITPLQNTPKMYYYSSFFVIFVLFFFLFNLKNSNTYFTS